MSGFRLVFFILPDNSHNCRQFRAIFHDFLVFIRRYFGGKTGKIRRKGYFTKLVDGPERLCPFARLFFVFFKDTLGFGIHFLRQRVLRYFVSHLHPVRPLYSRSVLLEVNISAEKIFPLAVIFNPADVGLGLIRAVGLKFVFVIGLHKCPEEIIDIFKFHFLERFVGHQRKNGVVFKRVVGKRSSRKKIDIPSVHFLLDILRSQPSLHSQIGRPYGKSGKIRRLAFFQLGFGNDVVGIMHLIKS